MDGRASQPPPSSSRRLYGNLDEPGVCIEWHDFEAGETLDWAGSFHAESLELRLNLAGNGFIHHRAGSVSFEPLTAGCYATGKSELRACLMAGERHQFITVGFSRRFLRHHLLQGGGALHPLVERVVLDAVCPAGVGPVRRLTSEQEQLARQMPHPPSFQGARRLWYQGKALQLIARDGHDHSAISAEAAHGTGGGAAQERQT